MGSRWVVVWVVVALVTNGLAVAAQRVGPRAHVHLAPLVGSAVDLDEDDDDDDQNHHGHHHHDGAGHFHASIGFHEHHAHDHGVVYVDDERRSSGYDARDTVKRAALDQEQLPSVVAPEPSSAPAVAPLMQALRAPRSHLAEPLDPPPRHLA